MNEQHTSHSEQRPEVPIIVIERENEKTPPSPQPHRNWLKMLAIGGGVFLGIIVLALGYLLWNYYLNLGVPISCTPTQNIEKLKSPVPSAAPEVVYTADSVLGVRLNLYELRGLSAKITLQEPDTADRSVYLYCRTVDYTASGKYLNTLVVEGKELAQNSFREGYCGMIGRHLVIGVGRSEAVKDYVMEQGGSYFRQYVLVSDGVVPLLFHLHGKIERRALGRIGNRLYYVQTSHPETMWDFADALREYGFVDALYITGGRDYAFYRDRMGVRHSLWDESRYPNDNNGITPWLVFYKK